MQTFVVLSIRSRSPDFVRTYESPPHHIRVFVWQLAIRKSKDWGDNKDQSVGGGVGGGKKPFKFLEGGKGGHSS